MRLVLSPHRLTRQALEAEGYLVAEAEHWIRHAKRRTDLFEFADLVAVRRDVPGVCFAQATTKGNFNSRLYKILKIPAARELLLAGNQIRLFGWDLEGDPSLPPACRHLALSLDLFPG